MSDGLFKRVNAFKHLIISLTDLVGNDFFKGCNILILLFTTLQESLIREQKSNAELIHQKHEEEKKVRMALIIHGVDQIKLYWFENLFAENN